MCLRHWQEPGRFQSKLPHGSDQFRLNTEQAAIVFQSTFPRGSDSRKPFLICVPRHFNPRSLAGATHFVKRLCCNVIIFQSTLPRGSDVNTLANTNAATERFQSTLPRGSDIAELKAERDAKISIHAPSRERRLVLV